MKTVRVLAVPVVVTFLLAFAATASAPHRPSLSLHPSLVSWVPSDMTVNEVQALAAFDPAFAFGIEDEPVIWVSGVVHRPYDAMLGETLVRFADHRLTPEIIEQSWDSGAIITDGDTIEIGLSPLDRGMTEYYVMTAIDSAGVAPPQALRQAMPVDDAATVNSWNISRQDASDDCRLFYELHLDSPDAAASRYAAVLDRMDLPVRASLKPDRSTSDPDDDVIVLEVDGQGDVYIGPSTSSASIRWNVPCDRFIGSSPAG